MSQQRPFWRKQRAFQGVMPPVGKRYQLVVTAANGDIASRSKPVNTPVEAARVLEAERKRTQERGFELSPLNSPRWGYQVVFDEDVWFIEIVEVDS